jgi:simple sugar transport system ATP-binding protein
VVRQVTDSAHVRPDAGQTPVVPAVETLGICKRFGANQALSDVSISISSGNARALVGRNGAGKSTLVAILTGLIPADSGTVRFSGEDTPRSSDPHWWRGRVACVYQKSTLVPTLSVAENLFLNRQPVKLGKWIDWRRLKRQASEVLEEWGLQIDVGLDAERLKVEQRQIVEIARALLQGSRFIILDEPTAALEGREVKLLFQRIARLRKAGVTLLYISHHLEEIYEFCDTVTVLRDGKVVADASLAQMTKDLVVAAMVGEKPLAFTHRTEAKAIDKKNRSRPALAVTDLSVGRVVNNVSFEIYPGECVGLAGLGGSGKEEIGDVVVGLLRPDKGTVRVAGQSIPFGQVARIQRKGVGYVPRDRHARGIIPQLSVAENLTLTIADRLGQAGIIRMDRQRQEAARIIDSLQIVTSSTEQPIAELSGGNQQKAVMGRALASAPRVLVLVYPTQGVDIASKRALFAIIEKARSSGTAVLLISDDVDELTICDRLLVAFKGRLTGQFGRHWNEREVVAAIEGVRAAK